MGKDKQVKLTKEQKKARELYRSGVVANIENLRRAPLSGSEKRHILKKDWIPSVLR